MLLYCESQNYCDKLLSGIKMFPIFHKKQTVIASGVSLFYTFVHSGKLMRKTILTWYVVIEKLQYVVCILIRVRVVTDEPLQDFQKALKPDGGWNEFFWCSTQKFCVKL